MTSISVALYWDPNFQARLRAACIRGLNKAAEALLAFANDMTPVDTGALRDSGTVYEANSVELASWVVYSMFYAPYVHENVGARFNRSKNPNAQAKFLEKAARQNAEKLQAIIAAEIRREFS